MAEIQISGLSELGEALKQFPVKLGQKYLRKATFAAASVIKDDAIGRAPIRTGALRDHIAVFKRPSDGDTAHYAIGVRGIKLTRKLKRVAKYLRQIAGVKHLDISGDLYYWRFLEFGTSKMPAHPFLRPAFEAQKENAIERFRAALADGVQAAADEVAK